MYSLGTERQASFMRVSSVFNLRTVTTCSLLAFALGSASCSGGKSGLNPVHGKVLYKDAPTGGIMIALHPAAGDDPKSQIPTGLTRDDGTFEIMTGQDEGASTGDYVATLVWNVEASGQKKEPNTMKMNSDVALTDKLKGRYSDRKSPVFKGITIKKGVNELEPFKLQ
jgi:hypothetical protein